ncbi:hypothetical protein FQN49_008783, partial [Arthroderma sp. PD_2]
MDLPLISTPSILVSDSTAERPRHQPRFHTNNTQQRQSLSYSDSAPPSPPYGPMAIPRSEETIAPPPLPPPRFIQELANGHDSGWRWGNTFHSGAGGAVPGSGSGSGPGTGRGTGVEDPNDSVDRESGTGTMLPPINPSSSLFGGHTRPPLRRRDETFHLDAEEQRAADARRSASGSGSGSFSEQDMALGPLSAPLLSPLADGSPAFSPTSPPTRSGRSLSQTGSLSHTLDSRILPST